jgi:acrylyl-CoA reductase (NADPH)
VADFCAAKWPDFAPPLTIVADSEMPLRRRIWGRLGSDLKPPGLAETARRIGLNDLPGVMADMLAGRTTGRTVVVFEN